MSSKFDLGKFVTRNGRRIAVTTMPSKAEPKKRRTDQHFGCPLVWVQRVSPLVKSKDQLLVAIWLYRRRHVCKQNPFSVPNETLQNELGLSRNVKYKTLRRLEAAGAIAVTRDNKQSLQVQILWETLRR